MNIIELVRSVVQEFPKIGELVHIDYSTNKVQDLDFLRQATRLSAKTF